MYSIVKGISYSTINSSLSTSSLCEDWPRRTTASNERVKGLGTGWNTNTQTYLKLFDYQSTTESSSGGQHIKRRAKSCNLSKEYKKKTSTELLLGIYLTKLNEEERWRRRKSSCFVSSRLGQREEASPHPLTLPPPLPAAGGGLSVTGRHLHWAHLDFFFPSILTPFTTRPPTHALHFSPMVLSFLTDQAFNSIEDSLLSYAYRTERKKKRSKNNKINVLWTLQEHF